MENTQENQIKEEKPKGKLSKKIIIICTLITLLVVVIIVAVYFVVTSPSKILEEQINSSLNEMQAEKDDFTYTPFTCSGFKEIMCNSPLVQLYDNDKQVAFKNLSFTLTPSTNEIYGIASGIIEISQSNEETETANGDIITINFNCKDNAMLLSERSMLAHNIICNSNADNIQLEQKSILYMRDEVFSETNMISALKGLMKKDKEEISDIVKYAISEDSYSSIQSPALFDDMLHMIQVLFKDQYPNGVSKEEVIDFYEKLKKDYISFKNLLQLNSENNFIDKTIIAVDDVIYNNKNLISMRMYLKDSSVIDDLFNQDSYNFNLPEYYEIEVESK